ncbi:MAG: DoxX family protein [Devosia nanyangense]|uniref:DoxX family protein n=1 Tax=Devosia nanyangense TaxID=1228055 RepID=A0A933L1M0_9HYPH|nr:DoxX family protein [Devosia nanyangense]
MTEAMTMGATKPVWRRLFTEARALLERVPFSIIQLAMRVAIGFVFFNAGLLKLRSFEFAVKLFAEEYRLPLIAPELAARLAMSVELAMPILLFVGLGTRFATLPLLAMSAVIVLLVYPASWVESLLWASVLVTLLTRGAGVLSLDYLIERRLRG